MGATGWQYIVPYQTDMRKVLDDLRREVFARGDYQKPSMELGLLDDLGFFETDEVVREEMISEYTLEPLREPLQRLGPEGLREWLEALEDAPSVITMEELDVFLCLTMSGTGSILDIRDLSQEPAVGKLFPLAKDRLLRSLGTDMPTRGMVETTWTRLDESMEEPAPYGRDGGIYFTLYRDGRPDEVYIEGSSGD
jgi:hypothetical protein